MQEKNRDRVFRILEVRTKQAHRLALEESLSESSISLCFEAVSKSFAYSLSVSSGLFPHSVFGDLGNHWRISSYCLYCLSVPVRLISSASASSRETRPSRY